MDDSLPLQSEYLQNRLRERKAESAKVSRLASQTPNPSSGRDDNIFNRDDALDFPNKLGNNRVWQSSPMGPPSRTGSRSTGTKSTTSSQPRAIGAREMDAHVEKLSKENFDLKLELYHRREKIDDLERKLRDVQQLEADAAELMQVNQDLCIELEKRDRAIDEAVVMICDLEEKVRMLQDQAADTRPSSFTVDTSASTNVSASPPDPQPKPSMHVTPPAKQRPHDLIPPQASPVAAGTLTELTTPGNAGKSRHVPSFIDSNGPTTTALRSMFVHGDRQIRPIPSAASLASGAETKYDETLDDSPRSPNLSELSESDFKSIYGRTTPKQIPHVTLDDLPASPDESPVVVIPRERKLARTNQWVHDRAISPEVPPRRRSSHGSQVASHFQSLGGALHGEVDHSMRPPSPTLARKQPLRFRAAEESVAELRPTTAYVPNALPPTPDTLATRQTSDHSSFSIVQDKSSMEGVGVADTHAQFTRYLESQARADMLDRDRAPRLFAYDGQQYYEDDGSAVDAQDFGASLFRHEGYAREAVSMPSQFAPSLKPKQPSLGGSTLRETLYDGDSFKQASDPFTTRRRTQQARPTSIHMTTTSNALGRVVNTLAPTIPGNLASERPLHRSISLSPTPSQPSLTDLSATFHTRGTGDLALASNIAQSRTPQRASQAVSNDRAQSVSSSQRRVRIGDSPLSEFQDTNPTAPGAFNDAVASVAASRNPAVDSLQPPKPASSMRQRMARFANRASISSPAHTNAFSNDGKSLPPLPPKPTSTPINQSPAPSSTTPASSTLSGTPTPTNAQRHSRSASATRRFFTQHRRRSSATPMSPTVAALRPSSKNGPDALPLRPRGSDTSEESARIGRTAAFLTAATAAAPFLSFDLNKGARPIPGIGIGASAPASPAAASRDADNVGTSAPIESGTMTKDRQRRGSRSSVLGSRDGRGDGREQRMSMTLAGANATMASWRT